MCFRSARRPRTGLDVLIVYGISTPLALLYYSSEWGVFLHHGRKLNQGAERVFALPASKGSIGAEHPVWMTVSVPCIT